MTLENQYQNNAAGQLLAGISAVATRATLQSGQGGNFPTANGTTTKFLVTTVKDTGQREVMVCKRTAGSDVIIFIDVSDGSESVAGRAQEGTTALAFEASDQVELRLTAAQITSFEEDIDALQTTVGVIDGDYLTSAHNPGGADEDDHDARYTPTTGLWTRAQLAAAGGGAPIDSEHLTGKDAIAHSELTDDEDTKHRLINDSAGNGDTTELWSADKIYDQLALKSDASHTHPIQNTIILNTSSPFDSGGFRAALSGVGPEWGLNQILDGVSLTGAYDTFDPAWPIHSWHVYIATNIDMIMWSCWYGAYVRDAEARFMLYNTPTLNEDVGSVVDTGTTRTLSFDDNDPKIYKSAVESLTSGAGWYILQFQMITTDNTPGRYGCGAVQIHLYDSSYA